MTLDADIAHRRTARWLETACLFFVALGLVLPVAYESPLFAQYRGAIAAVIRDPSLVDGPTARLAVGITGGSIAGKWLAHWAIVRFAVRARRRWALHATVAGLLGWFTVDSLSSLLAGAWANVVMVNLLPLLVVLPLAWRLRSGCDAPPLERDLAQTWPSRVALATSIIGVGAGLVIAFGMTTPLFDAWWAGLGDAHFAGRAPSESARTLVRFFAGPIGGSTVGQFVLFAFIARYATRAGEAWAPRWALLALLVWAVTDSTWSLVAGAPFNVLLVDVPCVALAAPPLVWSIAMRTSPISR